MAVFLAILVILSKAKNLPFFLCRHFLLYCGTEFALLMGCESLPNQSSLNGMVHVEKHC